MHVALEPRRTGIRRAKRKKVSKKNDTTKSGEVNKEREKMGEKKGKREATVHYLQSTAIVKDGRSREGTYTGENQ